MAREDIFKAIGDSTRRAILTELAAGPLAVHDIATRFLISRPAVSKHLRILSEAGLVRRRQIGRENHYCLEDAPLREVRDWLERFWSSRLDTLKALSERKH